MDNKNEDVPICDKVPLIKSNGVNGHCAYDATESKINFCTNGYTNLKDDTSDVLPSTTVNLKKSVGFMQSLVLLVGILIGSGIFVSPGIVMSKAGDAGISLVIWFVGGIIALGGSLCFCELGCMFKRAGGIYVYIYEGYGNLPAFLSCWTITFIIAPSGLAITALAIGIYIMKPLEIFIDPNPFYPKIIGCTCILFICFINCWSIEASQKIQRFFTLAQIVAVSFIVVIGCWKFIQGHTENVKNIFSQSSSSLNDIGLLGAALYNCMWSYEGWYCVPSITEEMKNLEKNLSLSLITGIIFVIVCYILVNLSFLSALTVTQIAESPAVAVFFVKETLGTNASFVIPVFVALSCYGACNADMFTVTRVFLAAGREGHLPDLLSMIHKERRTPIPSIILLTLLTLFFLIPDSNTLESLIQVFGFSIWLNYGLAISAVIILRYKSPKLQRPYKVWLSTAVIMSIVSVIMVVIPFLADPVQPLISLALIVIAVPIYYLLIYLEPKHPKKIVEIRNFIKNGLTNLFNLAPSAY